MKFAAARHRIAAASATAIACAVSLTAVTAPQVNDPFFYRRRSYLLTGNIGCSPARYLLQGMFDPKSPFTDRGAEVSGRYSYTDLTDRWRFELNYGYGSLNSGETGHFHLFQARIQAWM